MLIAQQSSPCKVEVRQRRGIGEKSSFGNESKRFKWEEMEFRRALKPEKKIIIMKTLSISPCHDCPCSPTFLSKDTKAQEKKKKTWLHFLKLSERKSQKENLASKDKGAKVIYLNFSQVTEIFCHYLKKKSQSQKLLSTRVN